MLNSLFESHARSDSTEPSPERQNEIVQQVEALKIQASIHQIASRLLARLGQHVTHLSQVWRTESAMAVEEFLLWTRSLANELGVSIDADGRIRDSWMPLPATWFGVRETTQKSVDQALQSLVHQRFFDSLTTDTNHQDRSFDSDASKSPETSHTTTESRRFDDLRLIRLVELALGTSRQAAIEAGLISAASEDAQPDTTHAGPTTSNSLQLDRKMLLDQLQSDDLKLLDGGGAKRTLLLLPSGVVDEETMQQWRGSLDQNITIAELEGLKSAILCVDGEQLELAQIVYRLWLPGRERCQLAERLHSRGDVEWLPME
jgi:hypothetical protein